MLWNGAENSLEEQIIFPPQYCTIKLVPIRSNTTTLYIRISLPEYKETLVYFSSTQNISLQCGEILGVEDKVSATMEFLTKKSSRVPTEMIWLKVKTTIENARRDFAVARRSCARRDLGRLHGYWLSIGFHGREVQSLFI